MHSHAGAWERAIMRFRFIAFILVVAILLLPYSGFATCPLCGERTNHLYGNDVCSRCLSTQSINGIKLEYTNYEQRRPLILPLIGVDGSSETLLINLLSKKNTETGKDITPYKSIMCFLRILLLNELSKQLALKEDNSTGLVEALLDDQIPILTDQLTVTYRHIAINGCLTKEVIEYLKQFACDLVKCLIEILSGDID